MTLSEMCRRSWCADAALVKTRLTTSETIRLAFVRAEISDEVTEGAEIVADAFAMRRTLSGIWSAPMRGPSLAFSIP
jgi:hypothetical protein